MNDIVLHFLISRPQDTYELEQQEEPRFAATAAAAAAAALAVSVLAQLCVSCTTADASAASLRRGGDEPPHLMARISKGENEEVKRRRVRRHAVTSLQACSKFTQNFTPELNSFSQSSENTSPHCSHSGSHAPRGHQSPSR